MNFRLLVSFFTIVVSHSLCAMESPDKIEGIIKQVQQGEVPRLRKKIESYLNLGTLPMQMQSKQFSVIRKICIKEKYGPLLRQMLTIKDGARQLDPDSWCYDLDMHRSFNLITEAVSHRAYSNVQILLKAGANPNCCLWSIDDIERTSPLYRAVITGDVELARLLLSYGADPNKIIEVVETLPLAQAILNYVNSDPERRSRNIELISLLRDHGACPDKKQFSAIYQTARQLALENNVPEILDLFDKRTNPLIFEYCWLRKI